MTYLIALREIATAWPIINYHFADRSYYYRIRSTGELKILLHKMANILIRSGINLDHFSAVVTVLNRVGYFELEPMIDAVQLAKCRLIAVKQSPKSKRDSRTSRISSPGHPNQR